MSTRPAPFDPIEFLQVAEHLRLGKTEGEWRSAISRAYYAAFLQAREVLLANRAISLTATGQDHAAVIRAILARNRSRGTSIDRLRVLRNHADYDVNRRTQEVDAIDAVTLARSFFQVR